MLKMRSALVDPELDERIAESALSYAAEYSWENQARRHYDLAERLALPSPGFKVPDVVIGGVGKLIDFRKYLGLAAEEGAKEAGKQAERALRDLSAG